VENAVVDDVKNADHRRLWLSKPAIIVYIATIAVISATFYMLPRWAANSARLEATRNSFMLTGMGIFNYDMLFKRLPPAVVRDRNGRPLFSWRGATAKFPDSWYPGELDRSSSWDGPENQQMADFPWRFCYDGLVTVEHFPTNYLRETCQMGIVGPGTALGDDGDPPKRLADIDGDTVLVVETRNSGIHWMKPGDFDIRTMPRTINAPDGRGISSRYRGGFHILFADGETWFLSDAVPFETLETFFTVKGARDNDREVVLSPFLLEKTDRLGGLWWW